MPIYMQCTQLSDNQPIELSLGVYINSVATIHEEQ
jgi:hypothetical protein